LADWKAYCYTVANVDDAFLVTKSKKGYEKVSLYKVTISASVAVVRTRNNTFREWKFYRVQRRGYIFRVTPIKEAANVGGETLNNAQQVMARQEAFDAFEVGAFMLELTENGGDANGEGQALWEV